MVSRNSTNLPTYFQLGKNSVAASEAIYTVDPSNKGLIVVPRGKRQNIAVQANILAKCDSGERLNLQNKIDSP